MDKKETKPSSTGDISGSNRTPRQEQPSLGHQAFDVFKDVLIDGLVKENRKLRDENAKLEPVNEMLNSTITVILAGKEYTLNLGSGLSYGNDLLFAIDADSIPLLDLAGESLFQMLGRSEHDLPPRAPSLLEPRLQISLGNVMLGNLSIFSGFDGGSVSTKLARNSSKAQVIPCLYINPSSKVGIWGELTNVAEDDLSDNLQFFDQQATARLLAGVPAHIRNEENIVFKMTFVRLFGTPELKETIEVLLRSSTEEVAQSPDAILPTLVNHVLEDDETLSKVIQDQTALKLANCKLISLRERIRTIDVLFEGGSLRLDLEKCRFLKQNSEVKALLDFPEQEDSRVTVEFNQLKTLRVVLAGISLNASGMRVPAIDYDTGFISFSIGHETEIVGCLDISDLANDFRFPDNNMNQALFDALRGRTTLPREVKFDFVGLVFNCTHSHSRVAQSLKLLGKWEDEGEATGES